MAGYKFPWKHWRRIAVRTLSASGVVALLGASAGCAKQDAKGRPEAAADAGEARRVVAAPVEELPAEVTVYATGILAAYDRADLSAKVPGRVQEIQVDLGSRVRRGDVLAQIDTSDLLLEQKRAAAALEQALARLGMNGEADAGGVEIEKTSGVKEARAVLNEAARNRERIGELQRQGIIPEAELETVESTYQVAENRYEQALQEARTRLAVLREQQADLAVVEKQIADATIRAPFDGIIERRQTSPGEYLNVGAVILTLVRVDPIRLRLEVSEKDSGLVRAGQRVKLRVEGSEAEHESRVARLSPIITAANRMLVVEADFPNPEAILRPGAFAKAEIVVDERQMGLFVPRTALTTFAGIQKVFTLSEGKAVEKEVKSGRQRGGMIEIVTGLKAGESVILEPGSLRSGQAVVAGSRAS